MSVLHINNITNKEGTGGPTIAGITTVDSTRFMRVPVGDTRKRTYIPPTDNIVTDGLVLHLDAGRPESYTDGETTWRDLSGQGNNGTLVNGVGYNSDNGGSLVFDGVNDRGTFTTPITSTSNQTYEIWTNAVASASSADEFAYILHNNSVSSTTGDSYLTIGIKQTQQYYAALNGAYATMSSEVTASNLNIVQITLTWDGATQKMYMNGDLKDLEALSTTPQNFSTTTSFGDYASSTYRMIQGNIYSIKIYNRALSATEIQQNYNALKGRYI